MVAQQSSASEISTARAMAANSSIAVPDAVTKALAVITAKEGFSRPRIDYESGSNAGDGYTSILFRARVQDEDPSRPEMKLLCKTLSLQSAEGFFRLFFVSEDYVYQKVIPAMKDIAHLEHPLPWPKCLFSTAEDLHAPCLVLEDLRVQGFTMADRRKPLDAKHCRLALRQLARYHGAGLALKHLRPDFVQTAREVLQAAFGNKQLQQAWEQFFQSALSAVDMIMDVVPDKLFKKVKAIFQQFSANFFERLTTSGEGPDRGLFHGDCHTNNMMFQYDKSGAVTDCKLIDFQTSRYGCMTWDLCSLLLPCTEKAMRTKHWDDLLRGYHEELQDTLRAAGIQDPDAVYSWDQFMGSIRTEFMMGLCFTPILLHGLFADKDDVMELQNTIADIDRQVTDGMECTNTFKIKETPVIKQRFADVVHDLEDWGWL